MGILDSFTDERNKKMYVYAYSTARNASGNVIKSYASTASGSLNGFHFQTSASNRVINDKYRQDIDSIFITDPLAVNFTMNEKDKAKIDSSYYEILYIENVGNQNEVLQIGLKKYEG